MMCGNTFCSGGGASPGALDDVVDLGVVEVADAPPWIVVQARVGALVAALVQQLPKRQPHLGPRLSGMIKP